MILFFPGPEVLSTCSPLCEGSSVHDMRCCASRGCCEFRCVGGMWMCKTACGRSKECKAPVCKEEK